MVWPAPRQPWVPWRVASAEVTTPLGIRCPVFWPSREFHRPPLQGRGRPWCRFLRRRKTGSCLRHRRHEPRGTDCRPRGSLPPPPSLPVCRRKDSRRRRRRPARRTAREGWWLSVVPAAPVVGRAYQGPIIDLAPGAVSEVAAVQVVRQAWEERHFLAQTAPNPMSATWPSGLSFSAAVRQGRFWCFWRRTRSQAAAAV